MASFASKRKARVIQTLDDEDADAGPTLIGGDENKKDVTVPVKFSRSKPAKSSSLRKSINFNDEDDNQGGDGGALLGKETSGTSGGDGDEEAPSAPIVIRPALSRSSSTRQKKRQSGSSRLSFGPGDIGNDGDDEKTEVVTPRKSLGHRALQNNTLRKSTSLQNLTNLPTRFAGFGNEDDRPRYSKEYLEELQSSTPNTPRNASSLQIEDDSDAMELDPSELDGALVVQSQDLQARSSQALVGPGSTSAAHILTEAEIRERKERRARLAKESEFISLSGSDEDESSSRVTLQFKKKKTESRLIAEDEDLGEGYDEFVTDGGLALGRKAERDAERRHRQEMADLIKAAEDGSDAESDDSEAERRAAYEAAQRRAGMDGLRRPDADDADMEDGGASVIPRMKPLPDMHEVLQRMRTLVQGLDDEVARKRAHIADLEKERGDIAAREKEVQEILNQAGAKYQALVGAGSAAADVVTKLVSQSPLRPLPPGIMGEMPVERGLESFGTTPTKRSDWDEEMT
ncbi:nineteen complex-related protein 2-domain-containing protein [Echria macrotheca]|uniref:Nineteen complex-related protein 2-domain-containing protein n=1 Tax=Echria macrotheca TaxID=438768 RepID=A0AAJ0B6U8_9PEZI|nr:nineteen complex-related protein 2-domain-containing protein [Echria macrotheca]